MGNLNSLYEVQDGQYPLNSLYEVQDGQFK